MSHPPDPLHRPCLAVLGGTGKLGRALIRRLARAGYSMVIGTRSPANATRLCDDINSMVGRVAVRVDTYLGAAASASIVVLCVPYTVQRAIAEEVRAALTGKILIDTTVPVCRIEREVVYIADHGSAVASLQTLLGESVKVVAALQNVSAHLLASPVEQLDCDVLVCGDNESSRDAVIELIQDIGLRGVHAGPIRNSVAAEALTSVLMWINANYKTRGAAIKVTLPEQPRS